MHDNNFIILVLPSATDTSALRWKNPNYYLHPTY